MPSANFSSARFVAAAAIAVAAVVLSSGLTARAAGTVEVELLTEKGFPFESTRAWLDAFIGLGIKNVQIRAAQVGNETNIDKRGRDDAPVYHVTGILAADGTLHLPGGRFKIEHKRRLGEWLKELAEHGPGGVNKPKIAAFGLTDEQFGKLKGDMARKVGFSTKGARIGEVVARIAAPLSHRLTIDGSATKALAGGDVVLDELSDVASGTALAAAVRPAGLILVPRVRGDEIDLVVTSSAGAKELWPVGWTSETAPAKLLPAIIKPTNVEIDETPLLDALGIVAKRLEAPVLFDHNNMARRGIDVAKASISLPAERLTYSNVLKKLLYQARLKYELRVDEADKPLLWISPLP